MSYYNNEDVNVHMCYEKIKCINQINIYIYIYIYTKTIYKYEDSTTLI